MSLRFRHGRIKSVILLAAVVMFGAGCFWQRDEYTTKMRKTMENWEKIEKYNKLLGDVFTTGDPIWFRPPKTVQLVTQPDDPPKFTALFQGGTPMAEVILYHSGADESMENFQTTAFGVLNGAQKGPGVQLNNVELPPVTSMHDNSQVTFRIFSAEATRQFGGAEGQPVQAVPCIWVVYFTEEPPQKLMIAYVFPSSVYDQFSLELQASLESLALGAKVGVAQGGAPAPAPAAPAGGAAPAEGAATPTP